MERADSEDVVRFTSVEQAAFTLHTPSEVNPESRLSLQDKKEEIYIKAPSPTQETNAIYPTAGFPGVAICPQNPTFKAKQGRKSIINDGEAKLSRQAKIPCCERELQWKGRPRPSAAKDTHPTGLPHV